MKSFLEYLREETDPSAQTQRGIPAVRERPWVYHDKMSDDQVLSRFTEKHPKTGHPMFNKYQLRFGMDTANRGMVSHIVSPSGTVHELNNGESGYNSLGLHIGRLFGKRLGRPLSSFIPDDQESSDAHRAKHSAYIESKAEKA